MRIEEYKLLIKSLYLGCEVYYTILKQWIDILENMWVGALLLGKENSSCGPQGKIANLDILFFSN